MPSVAPTSALKRSTRTGSRSTGFDWTPNKNRKCNKDINRNMAKVGVLVHLPTISSGLDGTITLAQEGIPPAGAVTRVASQRAGAQTFLSAGPADAPWAEPQPVL